MKIVIMNGVKKEENLETKQKQLEEYWNQFIKDKEIFYFPKQVEVQIVKGCDFDEKTQVYYYNEEELEQLKSYINGLIQEQQVLGLLIDPILTKEERKDFDYFVIQGKNAEEFFDLYKKKIPIAFMNYASYSPFFVSNVYEKIVTYFLENQYQGNLFSNEWFGYNQEQVEAIFTYFCDFYTRKKDFKRERKR